MVRPTYPPSRISRKVSCGHKEGKGRPYDVSRRAPARDHRRQPGRGSCPPRPTAPEAVRRLRVQVAQGGRKNARGQSLVPGRVPRRGAGRLRDAVVEPTGWPLPRAVLPLAPAHRQAAPAVRHRPGGADADRRYGSSGRRQRVADQPGEGEPWPFYQQFGFQRTGRSTTARSCCASASPHAEQRKTL